MLRSRRRPRYGAQVCAIIAALLLLLSVTVLHSRLGFDRGSKLGLRHQNLEFSQDATDDIDAIVANPLLEDDGAGFGTTNNNGEDDRIDELDVIEEETDEQSKLSNEEEILRGVEVDEESDLERTSSSIRRRSGYYYDHVLGVTRRRAFDKQATDPWEDSTSFELSFSSEDPSKIAFGSDDEPVDEDVRLKLEGIRGIEDAFLLKKAGRKVSPMTQGWATWFEKKGDFLRRDRMFKSNLELLNPLNNPLLQDPDGVGLTVLTRGDKLMQKALLNDIQKLSSSSSFPMKMLNTKSASLDVEEDNRGRTRRNQVKGVERRTLNENTSRITSDGNNLVSVSDTLKATKPVQVTNGTTSTEGIGFGAKSGTSDIENEGRIQSSELSDHIYADGRQWGYFPGLYPHLSFSEFMDQFFSKGKCAMRVFMVWNSPTWMYSVRHQRGLESFLYHHHDACVVVFSETIELDFFKDFVKDGFKVAVAMPNLDELLNNTPTQIFASIWFEWRKTKFYPIHYSELVRLAALYKYGGIYLDSDILVLKQLFSFNNSVGVEDELGESSLNGAVMAFEKNSLFIMECLKEFYSTYDDTRLRWNGADLLTRSRSQLLSKDNKSDHLMEVKVEPFPTFFPIGRHHITRYFMSPADETERTQQNILFEKIVEESSTFHFWNGLTSSIVPEAESLVARLLNRYCLRCSDVL